MEDVDDQVQCYVYDVLGRQQVINQRTDNGELIVDISGLIPGQYILKIVENYSRYYTEKVIIR